MNGQGVLPRQALAQHVLFPELEGLELPTPRRRRWPGLVPLLLAFGLHGLALAAGLVLAPGAAQITDFPVYEVDLVAFGPGSGTGHEEGAPADAVPVASPLPKRVEAAPAPKPRHHEAKPRPVKSAPVESRAQAPVAIPDPAASAVATAAPAPGEASSASAAAQAEGRSAEGGDEAQGAVGGHRAGLPQGQGQGLGQGGYGVGQVERPPHLVRKVEPRYPLSARQRQVSGKVLVRFLVDPKGHVSEVSVVEAHPEGWFEQSAIQAVSRWEFTPGVLHGRAVSVWMLLPITFTLN